MGASNWGTGRRLDESLFTSPQEFDFFQAVRLLTHLHSERRGDSPAPASEAVRFRVKNSLAFPASAVADIDIDKDNGGSPRMTVTFIGLTGSGGVLPAAYTDTAVDQECFGDTSFADFLDIFNHRLIWFFYRAWEKHHFAVEYEQSHREGIGQDVFTSYLFDLIGMGTDGLQRRLPIPDQALLRYAGLLSQRPHSAEALRALLHDYFGLPVEVEQLLGKWHPLETDEMCYLGSDEPNSQLGRGAVAGDAVWNRQALVRLVLGPLTAESFRSFLPNGNSFTAGLPQEAVALTRWFLGAALEFEVQPTLDGDEVPPCPLGDDTFNGARLGWSAWLRTESFDSAATDAIFKEGELIGAEV